MQDVKSPSQLNRLRRMALVAQGLNQTQVFGRGLSAVQRAINHLGYIQIDSISVIERAHHHVLYSRVPDYKPAMIDQLLKQGKIFEYWSHAAAFLPMADFRFSLPYKQAIKSGQTHWYKNPDKKLMADLLDRIRLDGPLQSRDLETKRTKATGWWDWKPAKKALEQLYMQGDLMVSGREGFQKVYDLTEWVLPSDVDTSMPTMEEYAQYLVDQQLRCHGLVTLKGLTYLRRNKDLNKVVKSLVVDRLAQGDFEQIQLDSGEVFIVKAGVLEGRMSPMSNRLVILSPFDNSVIQRDRLKSLFGFDYKIECYTPAAKRQYGYFSLPLLLRDEFIGRMDCKAHRKSQHLEIKHLHFEQHNFEQELVLSAFAEAIKDFSWFQQCDRVSLNEVYPKYFDKHLREAVIR
ncbi:MAG: winged helix DNA-binding domain-containing protein [Proteobacteria bacterium]|nr:winged helix DNA-binding domain-containing protein [Pseudomonadota bacterium]